MLNGKIGVWTHNAFRCYGHLHDLKNLGFDYIAVKITDGASAFSPVTCRGLCLLAGRAALPVAAWSYVYPENILETIAAIKDNLPAGCTDLILDCEAEWENKPAALAHELCHGIAEATGHTVSLYLSSFCNPTAHPLPYEAFLSHCQGFMPQVYQEGTTPLSAPVERLQNESTAMAKHALGGQLIPTINVPELVPRVRGYQGFNVWLADGVQLEPGQIRAAGDDMGVIGYQSAWMAALTAK